MKKIKLITISFITSGLLSVQGFAAEVSLKGEFNGGWQSISNSYGTENSQEDGNVDLTYVEQLENGMSVKLRLRQKVDGSAQQNVKISTPSMGSISFGDDDGAVDPVDNKVPSIWNDSGASKLVNGMPSDYKDGDYGNNVITWHAPSVGGLSLKAGLTKGSAASGAAGEGDVTTLSASTTIAGVSLAFGTAMFDKNAVEVADAYDSTFLTASTTLGSAKIGVAFYDSGKTNGDESSHFGVSLPVNDVTLNMVYSDVDETTGHDPSGYMIGLGKDLGVGEFTVEYHMADVTGVKAGEVETWRLGYSFSFGVNLIPYMN